MTFKMSKILLGILVYFMIYSSTFAAGDINITSGKWRIVYQPETKSVDYINNGNSILNGVFVKAKLQNDVLQSKDYQNADLTKEAVADKFGNGEKYTIRYSGLPGKPDLEQVFYFYPGKDYFLTEAYIVSESNISSNYIAPLFTETESSFLPGDGNNRILSVPFDNDGFIRYSAFPMTRDSVSFEVTAVFNGESREGLVIGSVEHDTWKTGVRYSTSDNRFIKKLECYGGIAHVLTRDINTGNNSSPKTSKQHGSIHGQRLKSPKILVGFFDDWRRGMDLYGEANALIAPPRSWEKGTPFGWNSWGAMETKVNPKGVMDISDFIKNELQPRSFENNGQTYIGLDSWWNDNFTNSELKAFVDHCNANGQEAGIYWGPFSDWSDNGERFMEGTNNQYRYKDAYLYADGVIRSIQSRSLDPTHPGTKALMKYQIDRFKRWGFKYIKLDFINSGIMEADSFYEEGITTGVQAYNHGMQHLVDLCGDDIYLALSIAPSFPAQYGHSKRLSCDVWGAIGQTGYLLNSLSYGWWLDKVYAYNDADHLVLYDEASNKKYSEGENRARITSGVITGIYMLGDNYSQKGTYPGPALARERALKFATNPEINEIARMGKSFYPVEGYLSSTPDGAENYFMMDTDEYVYFVVFNYHPIVTRRGDMELERLGIAESNIVGVKELWTGNTIEITDGKLPYSVPFSDARVYRITKKGTGIDNSGYVDPQLKTYVVGDELIVGNIGELRPEEIRIYSTDGKMSMAGNFNSDTDGAGYRFNIASLDDGLYIAIVNTVSGKALRGKFIK